MMLAALVSGGCGGATSTTNLPETPPSTQPEVDYKKLKGPLKKGIRLPRPPGTPPVPGGGPKSRDNPHGIG
jgi:hypothetical protein